MSKSNAAKRGARLLALALVLRCGAAAASSPYMVKDIDDPTFGSSVDVLGEAGSLFFLTAQGSTFRSDGTSRGTYPLARQEYTSRACTAALGDVFFACGRSGLLRTDGSPAGTQILKAQMRFDGQLAALGGWVYFDGGQYPATELWRTDGTLSGTSKVRVFAGMPYAGSEYPILNLFATSNRVFFSANDGDETGLFVSDGGAPPSLLMPGFVTTGLAVGDRYFFVTGEWAGTTSLWVTDGNEPALLRTFAWEHRPGPLQAMGDRLLFRAGDPANGREQWISDGTPEGTHLIVDLAPGPTSSFVTFHPMGGNAYFLSAHDLWRTDGSPSGTILVKDGLDARTLMATPSKLLVLGVTPSLPAPFRLWISDGTTAGTSVVYSGRSDSLQGVGSVERSGTVFFPLTTARYGWEIWKTDGTPSGTEVFVDINRYAFPEGPASMAAATNLAFFRHPSGTFWSTDGSEAGTRAVTMGGVPLEAGSVLTLGERGYSCGEGGVVGTDGTDVGTFVVSPSGHSCRWAVRAGDRLFFLLRAETGFLDLWWSDGTAGNATLVPNTAILTAEWPVALGDRILFNAATDSGYRPWVSDGTPSGTFPVADLDVHEAMVVAGGTGFFVSGPSRNELWKTDGTQAGTVRVLDDLTQVSLAGGPDGPLYLAGLRSGDVSPSLWRSDGTAGGTVRVETFQSDSLRDLVVSSGKLYFTAGPALNRDLWSSDGTEAGTMSLAFGSDVVGLTAVSGGIVFGSLHGTAFSDGTVAGTRVIGGPVSSNTHVRLGSMLLFFAHEPSHGHDLFRADLVDVGSQFYTVVPCRVADTRTEGQGAALVTEWDREVTIAGLCGVPLDATGVVLNVTATQSLGDGHLEIRSLGRSSSGGRAAAFQSGQTRATMFTLGLDPASRGKATLQLFGAASADVILDVSGYFR